MTDIDGGPDGDVEMTEREQVEGIEYDNRLENQYQATLFQQTDKRTQLEKLRDGYTKNIAKLNKEQLRSLFRDAQKAGMKETFTQCKNMNKQQAAVLQFYIKEFHANGVDIKKAPIFNPRKAKNDRPQKQRKRTRAQETTETTQAATAAKTSHKGNVDPEWMELVKILVLLQPSSAAAERVFSQLAGMFSKSQMSLLQDTMWIVIALRFHDRDL